MLAVVVCGPARTIVDCFRLAGAASLDELVSLHRGLDRHFGHRLRRSP